MTWTEISSPTFSAAAAPASVAAFTAPTSPRTMTVTRPPPTCSLPTSCTLAAFTMASAASMAPTSPFVSTIPSAFVLAILRFLLSVVCLGCSGSASAFGVGDGFGFFVLAARAAFLAVAGGCSAA